MEYSYTTLFDIVGLLGGLWATFKSISAKLGVITVVWYVFSLAKMIKRKDAQSYRIIEIKQFCKHADKIRARIK